ncbi:MAG: hypothetical protein R2853_07030 [Thermomicrobiales bacterium]
MQQLMVGVIAAWLVMVALRVQARAARLPSPPTLLPTRGRGEQLGGAPVETRRNQAKTCTRIRRKMPRSLRTGSGAAGARASDR